MKKGISINISKTVASLVKNLPPRNRDIISRRFGLRNGKRETLESIGRSYGITRERVRQIEEVNLNQLAKTIGDNKEIEKYISLAQEILKSKGGIIKESDLFNEFSGDSRYNVVNASLTFLLTLNRELVRFPENDFYHSFWSINSQNLNSFRAMSDSLINSLNKHNKVLNKDEFFSLASNGGILGFDGRQFSDKHLEILLTINKSLSQNIFNQVGLIEWAEIKPKGVRDKAYLVLKKEKNPKHFSEIAKMINVSGFDGKKANVQTVHNELIKDSRFVLIGRGMYALSEWGYKPGTVQEVLVDILKNSSKPIARAALIAKVMDVRMVKENTILLNLQNSKIFTKKDDGSYTLKG